MEKENKIGVEKIKMLKDLNYNIEFIMWLSGHDADTIMQMYNDWSKTH